MNADEIKQNVNLLNLARSYGLKVDRAGKCRCPFHNDRTPSMKVWTDHFHCFGCGAGGDVFEFVQRMEGCDFSEAVRKLGGEDRPGAHRRKKERTVKDAISEKIRESDAQLERYRDQLSKLRATLASAEPFSEAYAFACHRLPVVEERYGQTLELKWKLEEVLHEQ